MRSSTTSCHNIAKFETHVGRRAASGASASTARARPAPSRRAIRDVPAAYREVGQPVLIPGDMGRYSYVLAGTEKAMHETFGSTCHGAGRAMSRVKAKQAAAGRNIIRELEQRGIVVRGRKPPHRRRRNSRGLQGCSECCRCLRSCRHFSKDRAASTARLHQRLTVDCSQTAKTHELALREKHHLSNQIRSTTIMEQSKLREELATRFALPKSAIEHFRSGRVRETQAGALARSAQVLRRYDHSAGSPP